MLDISSRVYSNLVNDETMKKHLKGSGTTKNDKPPVFPYMYVKVLGEPTTSASLQNDQCAIKASFEITVYDSKYHGEAADIPCCRANAADGIHNELRTGRNRPVKHNRSVSLDCKVPKNLL